MTTTRSTDPGSQRWFDRALLTDASRCPSCSAGLAGPVCGACGLSLAGPAGRAVWDVSRRAAVLLDRRDALITSMRVAGAARTPEQAPVTAPVHVPTRPAPVAAPPSVSGMPRPAVRPGPMPRPPVAPVRQSWPLQNVLLGLGALLLAGASIVFLAFTWGSMPLALRATVIAVVTAAVFAAATLAARKALTSSADAIAALGSLLVVLDAWALHATGLVPAPDGAAYGALAALGSAGVLVALGIVLRLDVPRAVGCVLVPVAPALLSADAPSASVAALLLTVAVATCSIHLAGFCERRAAAVLRVLALVLVALALLVTVGAFFVDGPLPAACVLLLVAVVAHPWSVLPHSPAATWSSVAGASQTVATICAALAFAAETPAPSTVWLAPSGALVGAASVVLTRRLVPRLPRHASTAAWGAFFVATAAPVVTVSVLVLVTLTTARPVSHGASTVLWAGLAGLVVAVGGSFVHTALTRPEPGVPPVGATRPPLSPGPWFAALGVLAAGLLLPALLQTVACWLVLPLLVVAVAGQRLTPAWRTPLRAACFTAIGLAILLSVAASAGAAPSVARRDGQLVLAASLLVLTVALLVARTWVVDPVVPASPAAWPHPTATPAQRAQRRRANLLLGALSVGAAGAGTALAAATRELAAAWPGASLPLLALALGLVALADRAGVDGTGRVRVLSRRLAAVDLHAVLVATGVVNVVTVIATASTPGGWLVAAPAAGAPAAWVAALAVTSAVLLALLGGVLALGGERLVTPASVVACAAATPALTVLAAVTVRALTPHRAIEWEIISLVVVAFFPIVAAARRSQTVQVRAAMERSSVVLGTGVLLLVAARRPAEVLTVALVIAASATAAWALLPGRARAGWFALALGVGASWNALASGGVGAVEAYSAPGALVVAAVGAWQVTRRRPAGRPLLLAGTAVLVLPTTLLAPTSTQWRALAVVLALLLLTACVLVTRVLAAGRDGAASAVPGVPGVPNASATRSPALPGLTTWFLVLGLVASVVGVAGRAVVLAAAWAADHGRGIAMTEERAHTLLSEPTSQPGLWIVVAAVSVCVLSWLLGLDWPWLPAAGPRSWAAGLTALVVTVPAWILAADGALGDTATTWSVVSLLVLWGVVALLGTPPGLPRVRTRSEFLRRAVPPLVVAYVVVLGLEYTIDVPVDVLLTLVGSFVAAVAVRAAVVEPAVSTWSNASYGVFATLAPVTLALLSEPEGWRVVLGVVVASIWLVLGLRARWQAPVAIGGAALVLQVAVLVGPLGLAALTGVPGWVVLAVTGLVLLTLGLTYERQISTARATLRRYAELR